MLMYQFLYKIPCEKAICVWANGRECSRTPLLLRHAAVPYSIKEVDKESYDQPDCKSNPGEPRQGEHQSSTEGDSQEWNQGDEWTAKGPLHVRVCSS